MCALSTYSFLTTDHTPNEEAKNTVELGTRQNVRLDLFTNGKTLNAMELERSNTIHEPLVDRARQIRLLEISDVSSSENPRMFT